MRSTLVVLTALAALSACAGPTVAAPPVGAAPASAAPASAAPASAAPASVAPVSAAPASAVSPVSKAPGELPAIVRTLLDGRMLRHGIDLGALENAVKAGDLAAVAQHARSIADEPRIARPVAGSVDDTLNQAIPPTFFDIQDRLHQHAEALAAAAEARDAGKVKAAYEDLGQTCGQCHRVWFPMPSD